MARRVGPRPLPLIGRPLPPGDSPVDMYGVVAVTAIVSAIVLVAALFTQCSVALLPSEIDGAGGDPESEVLHVWGMECRARYELTVWEHSDRIDLLLEQRLPDDDCDSLPHAVVCLDAPLGDRSVYDLATGERVEVRPAEHEPGPCEPQVSGVAGSIRSQRLPAMSRNTTTVP